MSVSAPQTATVTAVPASTTSAALLAGGSRRGWVVSNISGQIAYLRFGSGAASATDHTVTVASGAYYESPQPAYGGPVQVVLAAGSGNVLVTSW
jgi:LysM repeat protein